MSVIIRKDYILDRYVYYAVSRKKRPNDFKKKSAKKTSLKSPKKSCFFCAGNESLTPPEIGRIEYKGGWKMRWFLNKFPAVEKKGSPKIRAKKFLCESDGYGVHEVIVETNHHKSQLWDIPAEYIKEWLEVIKFRMEKLSGIKGIKYVSIFKNHGADAGTSLEHSHTQIMALPNVPSLITEEVNASQEYGKKTKRCAYCDIIKSEAKSKRKISETKTSISIAPFASRFNFEAWIFPKRHVKNLSWLSQQENTELAETIKKLLSKLKTIDISYNLYFHYSPEGKDLHFHIEIAPRMAKWGGFELSTNSVINSILPEDAAKFYSRKI